MPVPEDDEGKRAASQEVGPCVRGPLLLPHCWKCGSGVGKVKFRIAFEKNEKCITIDQPNCSNSYVVSLCIERWGGGLK